jgi:photosystem II stability/assembly factor-like uncharacterized protein
MPRSAAIRLICCLSLATACSRSPGTPTPVAPVRQEQVSGTRSLLIAVSPVSDEIAWVAGANGTWVRTVNGGTTWTTGRVAGADSLQFRDVQAVDANTAYLLSIGNGDQSRIYKTTDAGQHWTLQFRNTDPKAFYDCMDFWDPRTGVVIGDAIDGDLAILTTSDAGVHWNRVPPASLPRALPGEGSFAASGLCVITRPGGHAWVVSNNADHARLLHSTDFGRTWSADTLPLTTRDGTGGAAVGFINAREGMIFGGGTTAKAGDAFIAHTSDGGRTWTRRTSPPLLRGLWGGVYVPGAKPATVVGVGPDGAVYSRDNGASWTTIDSMNYWSVGFASARAGWAVGMNGRITKLTNF